MVDYVPGKTYPPNAVFLNVYDLDDRFVGVNGLFRDITGAYHSGVQLYNREYTFGSEDPEDPKFPLTGVQEHTPKDTGHVYLKTLYMGWVTRSMKSFLNQSQCSVHSKAGQGVLPIMFIHRRFVRVFVVSLSPFFRPFLPSALFFLPSSRLLSPR
uniref:PPPDE domain-containing protein n=1 Tax=Chromera velia CCMP2878 TaxID=1169474 RepID=A0A0G4H9Y3_9ALVE|eukprot:Cvel_6048.t1-p1 / transcript=Cvel_6048.t1 / gene=Cvel_6048 / organism=Chromera_velia_CCMP2878 / gene_product=hypothetical protein / transcript_product=hypothetical protein / location=Cvel_scaffold290:94472-95471(+) / protein_length=154 / sequence_SO=supercontig / SO=protein_coding / is_pseudo=false